MRPAREALTAECHSFDAPVTDDAHPGPPSEHCGCGIYALTELTGACQAAPGPVLGCVALWGEVIEGPFGWQGSQAYPRILYVDPSVDEHTRAQLAADYGVPTYPAPVALDMLGAMPARALDRCAAAVREQAADLGADRGPSEDPEGPLARAGQGLLPRMAAAPARGALRSAFAAVAGLCLLPAALAVLTFGVVSALAMMVYRGPVETLLSVLFYVAAAYVIGQLPVVLGLRAVLARRGPDKPRLSRWGQAGVIHIVAVGALIPITRAAAGLDWPTATLIVLAAVGLADALGWGRVAGLSRVSRGARPAGGGDGPLLVWLATAYLGMFCAVGAFVQAVTVLAWVLSAQWADEPNRRHVRQVCPDTASADGVIVAPHSATGARAWVWASSSSSMVTECSRPSRSEVAATGRDDVGRARVVVSRPSQ